MERNRWEAAIRCLEIALHPHTTDDEVIAAVNGFRRTADGTPLSEMCGAFAAKHVGIRDRVADEAGQRENIERLNRENLELRRRLKIEASGRSTAARHLHDAEERIRYLGEELQAIRLRADDAEQRFADLRAAYADIADRARRPFAATPSIETEPPPARTASPFHQILTDTRQREDGMGAPRAVADAPIAAPSQRTPWTA